MTDRESTMEMKLEELNQKLQETRDIALYYQWLAVRSGRRCVRETDQLTKLNSTQLQAHRKLERRLALQDLIHSIASRFLNISPSEFNSALDSTLREAGSFYFVDASFLALLEDDQNTVCIRSTWRSDRLSKGPNIEYKQKLDKYPELAEQFKRGEPLVINSVRQLKNTMLKNYLSSFNIQSLIVTPLMRDNKLMGIFGFSMLREIREWDHDDIAAIQTIADLLSSALDRAQAVAERLKLEEQLNLRQRIDSLGTLAGGIAHDINNILVSIMGNIELAIMKASDHESEQAVYLERAFHSCEHAASLVREIRVFSHGASMEITAVDLYAIANEVLTTLQHTSNSMIQKRLDIEPDTYYVMANPDLLHQTFLNLGCNAVQAIEERGIQPDDYIGISAEPVNTEDHGDSIHIVFRDNGIGMTDEIRNKAFEPLFTTKRGKKTGQGLGLSMVYHLITENLSGAIEIESEYGKGTAFHIYLPTAECPKISEQTTGEECFEGNETILVIDDDHAVAELASDTLEMYGYSTHFTTDGREGVELFHSLMDNIDLVILDLIMPDLSGEEVIQALKKKRADIPIIIISGKPEDDLVNIPGSSAFIPKPFTVESLTAAVRRVLDGQ